MNSTIVRHTYPGAILLSIMFALALALASAAARAVTPGAVATAEEHEVWKAMADIIAKDHAQKPYNLLFFKSDFAAASFIASAMSDPDREQFCGLSGPESQEMVARLKLINAIPVELDRKIAKSSGFGVARRKVPRLRYFSMSRVVFDPKHEKAFLSVELNGERGSIVRLDKVAGRWDRTYRCGGWYMQN
jgi:hypothetical protein